MKEGIASHTPLNTAYKFTACRIPQGKISVLAPGVLGAFSSQCLPKGSDSPFLASSSPDSPCSSNPPCLQGAGPLSLPSSCTQLITMCNRERIFKSIKPILFRRPKRVHYLHDSFGIFCYTGCHFLPHILGRQLSCPPPGVPITVPVTDENLFLS